MLQIKKNSTILYFKYNLNFLFRNKKLSNFYKASKHVSQSITLRAPKNFNIGKHKILNLNYQTHSAILTLKKKIKLNSFISQNDLLFNACSKSLLLTPTLSLKSAHISIRTQFKIMWLGI